MDEAVTASGQGPLRVVGLWAWRSALGAMHWAQALIVLVLLAAFLTYGVWFITQELWDLVPYPGQSVMAPPGQSQAPAEAVTYCCKSMSEFEFELRASTVFVFSAFLPLIGYSFYFFRRRLRVAEIERIWRKLVRSDLALSEADRFEDYVRKIVGAYPGLDFAVAVVVAWAVSLAGLAVLFVGTELGLTYWTGLAKEFPVDGSLFVTGMAFLGAYLWGLQNLLHRHVVGDLTPDAFYVGVLRMVIASATAFVFFNAAGLTSADPDPANTGLDGLQGNGIWAAAAFLTGIFPQRALDWLMERIPIFSARGNAAVRTLPLDLIQGVSSYDKMRLDELGIESCYDLADADFFPLLLKSSYGPRELADWILQAKLCVYCGAAVADLREEGIRWVSDLEGLDDAALGDLAQRTHATKFSLKRAQAAGDGDEVGRLQVLATTLSQYTPHGVLPKPMPAGATS